QGLQGERSPEKKKERDCLGLVERGWAARSAVQPDDEHVPQSRGGTAGRINATASANARRGVPDRRLARRRRVLLWPPRPDTSSVATLSIDRQESALPDPAHPGPPKRGGRAGAGQVELPNDGGKVRLLGSLIHGRLRYPFRGRRSILRFRRPLSRRLRRT